MSYSVATVIYLIKFTDYTYCDFNVNDVLATYSMLPIHRTLITCACMHRSIREFLYIQFTALMYTRRLESRSISMDGIWKKKLAPK